MVIIDAFEYRKKFKNTIIPKEMNAIFCIPIIPYDDYDGIEKRRSSDSYDVKGYLYFDTDSVINNFSELTAEFCEAVSKIAYILVDNYNLRAISSIDKLTGLYTRKYFESALQKEILNASMGNQELSIIMMDIDRFKAVNDRFGHQIGDEILSQIASLIMTNIRETDICGRYGGEEFVLLLPSTSIRDAYKIAENLRKKIKGSVFIESNIITISMGIAVYPEHSIWMKDLIDKADQALYYSKENGRDRTTIYDVNMGRTVKRADKLTGIISGNMVDDMRNVEIMIETLELQCDLNLKQEEKVFDFLGKIIEVSGAKAGSIFILDDDKKPIEQISRKRMVNKVIKDMPYSSKLLMECIENAKGSYSIDYDSSAHIDAITGMPSLQSKMLVPIKNRGKILAVLYLSVSSRNSGC